ncbi:hypothetical protein ABZ826_27765 [Streptomyces sp. NPDC047515]|uniref:hypothetical protein n=1 Tax=Streptomyces sp. NPDC047515 TaxID=3155380 RepID=UPI0033CB3AE3
MDAALQQLRVDAIDVRDHGVARLSPFARGHVNTLGRYSSQLPELPAGCVRRGTRMPATASRALTGPPRGLAIE